MHLILRMSNLTLFVEYSLKKYFLSTSFVPDLGQKEAESLCMPQVSFRAVLCPSVWVSVAVPAEQHTGLCGGTPSLLLFLPTPLHPPPERGLARALS